MGNRYSRDMLAEIKSALESAPPPEESDDMTGRTVVSEMFEDIFDLRSQGHTFQSITEILSKVGVRLSATTLSSYFRDEQKDRRREERRRKKLEKNGKPVDLPNGKTPIKAKPAVDVINATIEDEDDDEIQ